MSVEQLEKIASQIRGRLVQLSQETSTPHLGGSLSCVDIMTALYWSFLKIDPTKPDDVLRDRCILSKGHAAPSLFVTLAMRGFFPMDDLLNYAQNDSKLGEHPSLGSAPGVEASTGSLGHGLPIGIGMSLAGRIQDQSYRVVVVMSDGECNEGSVWEAAMFAPIQKLDNLIVVVDFNQWQATGRSTEVMSLQPLAEKWQAFGWNTFEVDGHDMSSLVKVFDQLPVLNGKPTAVIANTIKGKGVSFMEDDNNWHYRSPTEEEVQEAHRQLGLII